MEKKTVVLAIVGLGIGIASIFFFKKFIPKIMDKKKKDESKKEVDTTEAGVISAPIPDAKLPIKLGDSGKAVQTAQKVLNKYVKVKYELGNVVGEDGNFGEGTEKAFKKYTGKTVVTKVLLKGMINIIKKG